MRPILVVSLTLLLSVFWTLYSAPPQVKFIADVKSIEVMGDEVALLTMSLTPEFEITVRVTGDTEIRDQDDEPLTAFDLEEGMTLKVEGLFTEEGILAQEIDVKDDRAEFKIRGKIDDINSADREISVLVFVINVPENAEIKDEEGNSLLFSELELGQLVVVKGNVIEETLVARRVKVRDEKDRVVRIHFEGTVTSIEGSILEVSIEGAPTALVKITDETEIEGDLMVGVLVRVFGTIEPDLSVSARRILVQQPLQLTPDKLELGFDQAHRVEAILRQIRDIDVDLTITSLDPAIAQPSVGDVISGTVTLTIPAGKVSGGFQVVSGTTEGETAIEVQMPESLGGFTAALQVEVEEEVEQPDEELEIRWTPRKVKLPTNKTRRIKLHLNQPAPADLTAEIVIEEGPEDLVELPGMVSFEPGSRFAVVEIASGPEPGEVEIEARLPEAFGGDDADVEIEVKQRGRGDDDDDDDDGDDDD